MTCVYVFYKLSKLECRIHKSKTSNLRTKHLCTAYHMPGSAQSTDEILGNQATVLAFEEYLY